MSVENLYVTEDTSVDELLEYVRHKTENPIRVQTKNGEKLVWNFSTYELDPSTLDLDYKKHDRFVIPFQVTSTWAMMFVLLPEKLRTAETLIWHQSEDEFFAYNQFYRDLSTERREEFRRHLSKSIE